MKLRMASFIILLSLLMPVYAGSASGANDLARWCQLLQKGNPKEKKLALSRLPFYLKEPIPGSKKEAFAAIWNAFKDKDPSIRQAAAASLKELMRHVTVRYKSVGIIPALIRALKDENAAVRREAAKALAYSKDLDAIAPLSKRLQDDDLWVHVEVAYALGELKSQEAAYPLLDLLVDNSSWQNRFVQQECIKAIRKIGYHDEHIIKELIKRFHAEHLNLEIIKTLGKFQARQAKHHLFEATRHPDNQIKLAAFQAVIALVLPAKETTDICLQGIRAPLPEIRLICIERLAGAEDKRAVEPLIQALDDNDEKVKQKAIKALGNYGDVKILKQLIPFFGSGKMSRPAEKSFMAVSQKSAQRLAFIYWLNGRRHIVDKMVDLPQEVWQVRNPRAHKKKKFSATMVHPQAVDGLIAALTGQDEKIKASALRMLGRFQDKRIQPIAVKLLNDPAPQIRQAALFALSWMADEKIIPAIVAALEDENANVRREAVAVLEKFKDNRLIPHLIKGLKDSDHRIRSDCAAVLGNFQDPRALAALLDQLNDDNPFVRRSILWALTAFDDPEARDAIIGLLNDPDSQVRWSAAKELGDYQDKKAVNALLKSADDPDPGVRRSVHASLLKFKDDKLTEVYTGLLCNGSHGSKQAALNFLKKNLPEKASDCLIALLEDDNAQVRMNAATILGSIGDTRAVDPLIRAVTAPSNPTGGTSKRYFSQSTNEAIRALGNIGDKKATAALIQALDETKLQSNAIDALGKLKDARAIPALIIFLKDQRIRIRSKAILALGNIGDPAALDHLESLVFDEKFPKKYNVVEAIGKINDKRAWKILADLLERSGTALACNAAQNLARAKQKHAIATLLRAAQKRKDLSQCVARALRHYKSSMYMPILTADLESEEKTVKRAAIIILGELGGAESLAALKAASADPDPEIQRYGRQSIRKIEMARQSPPKGTRPRMIPGYDPSMRVEQIRGRNKRVLVRHPDQKFDPDISSSQITIATRNKRAMKPSQPKIPTDQLITQLSDTDPQVRQEAVSRIGWRADKTAGAKLIPLLQDPDIHVRRTAAIALGRLEVQQAVEPLIQSLKDPDINLRVFAIGALGELGDSRAVPHLRALFPDKAPAVRRSSFLALSMINDPAAKNSIISALSERRDYRIRREAADILGDMDDRRTIPRLMNLLDDKNEYVRQAAARSLAKLGAQDAVDPLIERLEDADLYVRLASIRALGEIGDSKAIEPLLDRTLIRKEPLIRQRSLQALRLFQSDASRDLMLSIFSNHYNSEDVRERSKSEKILSILGDDTIIRAWRDRQGEHQRTISNYIKLMDSKSSVISRLGQGALQNHTQRALVIEALSASIKSKKMLRESEAVWLLVRFKDPRCQPLFIHVLEHRQNFSAAVLTNTCAAVGALKLKIAAPLLLDILEDDQASYNVKAHAGSALAEIGDKQAVKTLISIVGDPAEHKWLRETSAIALGKIGDERAVKPLVRILSDPSADLKLRAASASALGAIGGPHATASLQKVMQDAPAHLKKTAKKALSKISNAK